MRPVIPSTNEKKSLNTVRNFVDKLCEKQDMVNSNESEEIHSNNAFSNDDWVEWNILSQRNWNKPIGEEGSRAQSVTSEQQMSDPSRSTIPDGSLPDRAQPAYEPNFPVPEHQEASAPISQSIHEPGSSRMSHPDEESFALPQNTASSAPRMIQQSSSGKSVSQNAFKRLKSMGSSGEGSEKLPVLPPPGDLGQYGYPTTHASDKKPETQYPGYKAYQVTRCMCGLTTAITILLVLLAIITIALAFSMMEQQCQSVSVMMVLMDIVLLVIVILEWVRAWLWREPTPLSTKQGGKRLSAEASMGPSHAGGGLPMISHAAGAIANSTYPAMTGDSAVGGFLTFGFQQRLYDVPQFVSALCLVILYSIGAICIIGTIIAAGLKLEVCSQLSLCAAGFAAVLAVLICIRMVMCCLSDACRGICHRTATATSSTHVPLVAINQLHQVLPGMGRNWHTGGEGHGGNPQPTAWLVNLSGSSDPRHQLSMIQPMPAQYANDLTH